MAACCLSIEDKTAYLQSADNFPVSKPCQPAHLCGYHNRKIAAFRRRGKRGDVISISPCLDKSPRYVASDVKRFRHRAALGNEALKFVRSCQVKAFRQLLNLDADRQFHMSSCYHPRSWYSGQRRCLSSPSRQIVRTRGLPLGVRMTTASKSAASSGYGCACQSRRSLPTSTFVSVTMECMKRPFAIRFVVSVTTVVSP